MKKKRNVITKINNTKNGNAYQIGLDLEQKIRNGIIMPDYEINSKYTLRFGDIVLKYTKTLPIENSVGIYDEAYFSHNSKPRIFEVKHTELDRYTFVDGSTTKYAVEFSIENAQMGNFGLGKIDIVPSSYIVKVKNTNMSLQYFSDDTNDWVNINIDFDHLPHGCCKFIVNKYFKKRLRIVYDNFIREVDFSTYCFFEVVNPYQSDNLERFKNSRGIFFSKNNIWYYVVLKNFDDINVKRGKMKYIDNKRYHYGLTKSSGLNFNNDPVLYFNETGNSDYCSELFEHKSHIINSDYTKNKNFNWKKMMYCDYLFEKNMSITYNNLIYTCSLYGTIDNIYEFYNILSYNGAILFISRSGDTINRLYVKPNKKELYVLSSSDIEVYSNPEMTSKVVIDSVDLNINGISKHNLKNKSTKMFYNVIKPYNGKYALFKYYIWTGGSYIVLNKKFQKYLSFEEVPENLNHLKGYRPLAGERKA